MSELACQYSRQISVAGVDCSVESDAMCLSRFQLRRSNMSDIKRISLSRIRQLSAQAALTIVSLASYDRASLYPTMQCSETRFEV